MPQRLLASLEIIRPHNMLAAAFTLAVGYYVAGGREPREAALPVLLAALITGAGNVINDCFDVGVDRVNKPRRPLPSGRIDRRSALFLYAALTVGVTASLVFFVSPQVAAVMFAWQALLVAYAAWLKRVFLAGNVLVAAVTSSAFFAGALVAGGPGASAIPVAIAFVFVFARELVKGAEDVDGDTAAGVRTVAVVFGTTPAAIAAAAVMTTLAVLIPVPYIADVYGSGYLWGMALIVMPCLLVGAWLVVRRPRKKTFTRVSWTLKVAMFFGILAIALG